MRGQGSSTARLRLSVLAVPIEDTNLVRVHPFHGPWSKEAFKRFLRQLLFGQDLHDVFLLFAALNDTVIFERQELWFFVFPDGGEDRPGYRRGWVQSKIRRVRMGSVGGEYRGKDGFMGALRYLDGQ